MKQQTQTQAMAQDLSWVLIKPRLTEKAAEVGSENIYTFIVALAANKIQIKQAIKMYYKVTPLRVNVLNNKERKVIVRGNRGVKSGFKKAMVHIKKGQTINLI